MSDSGSSSGGIGICGLLGILFVGLKLGGVIDWSWWWVICPFWIGFVLFSMVFFGELVIAGIIVMFIGIYKLFFKN